jgi:hypothetical protein
MATTVANLTAAFLITWRDIFARLSFFSPFALFARHRLLKLKDGKSASQ